MAKKSVIEKNKNRKKMVRRYKTKRLELKKIITNKTLPLEERFAAQLKLAKLPRNGAEVRVRNRCLETGRGRGFYRKFELSRICLREHASSGELTGVIKASW